MQQAERTRPVALTDQVFQLRKLVGERFAEPLRHEPGHLPDGPQQILLDVRGGGKIVVGLEKLQDAVLQAGRGILSHGLPQRVKERAGKPPGRGQFAFEQVQQFFGADLQHLQKLCQFLTDARGHAGRDKRARTGDQELGQKVGDRAGGAQRLQKRLEVRIIAPRHVGGRGILPVGPRIGPAHARRVGNILDLCIVWGDWRAVCIGVLPRGGVGDARDIWHSKASFPRKIKQCFVRCLNLYGLWSILFKEQCKIFERTALLYGK